MLHPQLCWKANARYLTAGAQCETTCPDGCFLSPFGGRWFNDSLFFVLDSTGHLCQCRCEAASSWFPQLNMSGFYRSPINGKPIGRECPRCPEDCNKCEDASAIFFGSLFWRPFFCEKMDLQHWQWMEEIRDRMRSPCKCRKLLSNKILCYISRGVSVQQL